MMLLDRINDFILRWFSAEGVHESSVDAACPTSSADSADDEPATDRRPGPDDTELALLTAHFHF